MMGAYLPYCHHTILCFGYCKNSFLKLSIQWNGLTSPQRSFWLSKFHKMFDFVIYIPKSFMRITILSDKCTFYRLHHFILIHFQYFLEPTFVLHQGTCFRWQAISEHHVFVILCASIDWGVATNLFSGDSHTNPSAFLWRNFCCPQREW